MDWNSFMGTPEKRSLLDRYQIAKAQIIALVVALKGIVPAKTLERMCDCQAAIDTKIVDFEGAAYELITGAYRCKFLLCPVCQLARAVKNIAILSLTIELVVTQHPELKWAFWTLTKGGGHSKGKQGRHDVSALIKAWADLRRLKRYRETIIGDVRCLEISRNALHGSLHGHLHNVIALPSSYSPTSSTYVTADQLREDWGRKLCGRQVRHLHMKMIPVPQGDPSQLIQQCVEASWYSHKATDIGLHQNQFGEWECDRQAAIDIYRALKGRRKISMGGVIREQRRILNLPDYEERLPFNPDREFASKRDAEIIIERTRYWSEILREYREG